MGAGDLAALEHHQGRDAADVVLGRYFLVGVDIDAVVSGSLIDCSQLGQEEEVLLGVDDSLPRQASQIPSEPSLEGQRPRS